MNHENKTLAVLLLRPRDAAHRPSQRSSCPPRPQQHSLCKEQGKDSGPGEGSYQELHIPVKAG